MKALKLCVVEGCVYVAGGFNGTADLASVEVLRLLALLVQKYKY